jgi:integrase
MGKRPGRRHQDRRQQRLCSASPHTCRPSPRVAVALPYPSPEDFLFPSETKKGKSPLYPSTFVADYLRPAASKAGVKIASGRRFGLHNLRHSLSNWLVNTGRVQPKTVQGLLRHSKIQTTLDLYTQSDGDETRAAQGQFLNAVGLTQRVQ